MHTARPRPPGRRSRRNRARSPGGRHQRLCKNPRREGLRSRRSPPRNRGMKKGEGPAGTSRGALPCDEAPSTGQRRPALPRASPAVPSALAGLASGFGMGPGVPRPPGPLTGGRRSAAPGRPRAPEGRTASRGSGARIRRGRSEVLRRARAISTPRLSASPRLHLGPINQVVYLGPYRKEN